VQEGVLGVGRDRVVTLRCRLAGNPLAGHEQAHRALAFVVQRAHGGGLFGRIQIAAARRGATKRQARWLLRGNGCDSAGSSAPVLRQAGPAPAAPRRVFQLHVFQGHAHRRQPGRAAEQLDVELFGLAFDQILEAGGDAARRDQRSSQCQGERDRQPGNGGGMWVMGVPLEAAGPECGPAREAVDQGFWFMTM
jgi:hypothetical protein